VTGFIGSDALRDVWYPVAETGDITDEPVAVRLLGEDHVVWRTSDGALGAAPDRCPHRESPLSIGAVVDDTLTCPYHGWGFAVDGRCVTVPSSGTDATVPPAAHLPCVKVQERYGLVWMSPGDPAGDIPGIGQDDDPAFRRINSGMQTWAVSTPRMVDNFLDISHFPWVHTGTFGRAQDTLVPRIELAALDNDWFGYAYEVDAGNPAAAKATTGTDAEVVHRHMSTGFHLPFLTRSTILYEDGLEHILLLCSTPIDDLTSLFTFVIWRNDDHSADPEETIAFDRAIGAEDKRMLERVPGTLPLGRTDLVSVQSDKPSVEWRRRFAEMIGVTGA
jgi:phenylpropionate dioxygenase-like ring-hydroxylating dioxygenase large terminal subunit